jgi:hypothetical protein
MSTARVGSIAGWLTLAAILVIEVVLPSVLTGLPVSGTTDRAVVTAYYGQAALLPLGLLALVTIVGFVIFVAALRDVLARRDGATFWANTGFGLALIAAALLLVRTAIQMALVRGVAAGSDVMPTFFAWDFTYNAAVYAMEASYPLAFALAMATWPGTPRWLVPLAGTVAVLQLLNMTALVVGLPFAATIPGTLGFVIWFGVTAWQLGRIAQVGDRQVLSFSESG